MKIRKIITIDKVQQELDRLRTSYRKNWGGTTKQLDAAFGALHDVGCFLEIYAESHEPRPEGQGMTEGNAKR